MDHILNAIKYHKNDMWLGFRQGRPINTGENNKKRQS